MIRTSTMASSEVAVMIKSAPQSSSRILDIPCKVCGDYSSGKHYNIYACDGCAGFFKRSIRRNRQYICKAKAEGTCIVDKTHRNQCRACRLAKCQEAGMNKEAVQHERGPRNSTLRRQQMMQFYDDRMLSPNGAALDLAIPKPGSTSPGVIEPTVPVIPAFMFNPVLNRIPIQMAPPPAYIPNYNQTESTSAICESAARLLFMNVQWAKNLPMLDRLSLQDQLLLLEESWRELFIIGAAVLMSHHDFNLLVQETGILQKDSEKSVVFLQEVKEFQELISRLSQFHVDSNEFACIRSIVLFKTNFDRPTTNPGVVSSTSSSSACESRILNDAASVQTLQDHMQLTLNKYISATYPTQPLRFGKLLMLLPQLRLVSCETIEELFFRKTIGNIPIVRIICDMYKSTKSDISS